MFYIKAIINDSPAIDFKGINMYENLNIIAQEIINLAYKKQFYKNGSLVDQLPTISYPIYVINKVEYMIFAVEAIVWFHPDLKNKQEKLKNKLDDLIYIFNKDIYEKFPDLTIKCPVSCTTNFTSANLVTNDKLIISYIDKFAIKNQTNNIFNYTIRFENKFTNDLNLKCCNIKSIEKTSKSLYSIIYDTHNVHSIIDKTLLPDYPNISQLTVVLNKKMLCDKINYNIYYGLTAEIAKYYVTESAYNLFSSIPPEYKLQWIEWENLSIYESNSLDPVYQINSGILDENFPTINLKKTNKIHKCFMTGIPIYDDCYVFDIYARYELKVIPENKLSKYKNWEVVEEFNPKDIEHVIQCFKKGKILFKEGDIIVSNYYGLLIMKKKDKYEILYKKNLYENKAYIYNYKGLVVPRPNSFKQINYDFYHEKNTYIQWKNNRYLKIDYSDMEFYMQTGHYNDYQFNKVVNKINNPKINDKYIVVRKLIKYDKPRYILISSWYVHFYGISNYFTNTIYKFEELTNSKFIIYRTKSPTNIDKVIDILPTSDSYKNLYKSIDKNILSITDNYDASFSSECINTNDYTLYSNFHPNVLDSQKIVAFIK